MHNIVRQRNCTAMPVRAGRFYVASLAAIGFRPELLLSVFSVLVFIWLSGPTSAQTSSPPRMVEDVARCRAIAEDAARLRCFEAATSKPPIKPQQFGTGMGTWRLVRTKDPGGGRDAVAIMQTADITKSDIDLAGLMLRCAETGVEVLVVLVRPLPPRAHPKVTVSAGNAKLDFGATVVPPGAAILLPKDATVPASGPWTGAPELFVQVEVGQTDGDAYSTKGTIPLAGLGAALATLRANCPQP